MTYLPPERGEGRLFWVGLPHTSLLAAHPESHSAAEAGKMSHGHSTS